MPIAFDVGIGSTSQCVQPAGKADASLCEDRLWGDYNSERAHLPHNPTGSHPFPPSQRAKRSAVLSWRIHSWWKMCLAFYPTFSPSLSVSGVMGVETHLNMSS